MNAKPWDCLPVNFLLRHPEGMSIRFVVLGPLRAVHCFDIFHPFYRHIFFPLLFVECSWDQRTQKVRPLWPLYQCQGVYFTARVSLHHFSKLHFLFSPLCFHSCPLRLLSSPWLLSASAHLHLAYLGMGKCSFSGFCVHFKSILILERLGTFPRMSEKLRSGRNGGKERAILYI